MLNSNELSQLLAEVTPLDDKQIGSIRHIHNLAGQPPNDWSRMMPFLPMQEDHGAYRFQLAYMALALGLAYRHRLPAARGVFQETFDKLIQKMMHPEVWLYWRDTSRGKGYQAIDAPELPSEIDPVKRDNIMYSAYLQVMVLLYRVLFDDDKYTRENAIKFQFEPHSCLTDRHQVIGYNEESLNETIYWNMVQSGYLGVACEPYCIFQICNQVPIIGFRLYDWLHGTSLAEETTTGYRRAWEDFGGPIGEDGHYTTLIASHTMKPAPVSTYGPWSDSWLTMLRNSWDGDFVRENYLRHRDDWLVDGPDGTLSITVPPNPPGLDIPLSAWGDFGWIVGAVSEMGDEQTLGRLFDYADRFMVNRWEMGGFYYPRNDVGHDEDGNFTAMSPTIGNALMPYARLNVSDGLRMLYDEPLARGHHEVPAIHTISEHADVTRARYLPDRNALVISLRAFDKRAAPVQIAISGLSKLGEWTLYLNGEPVARGQSRECQAVLNTIMTFFDNGPHLSFCIPAPEEQILVFVFSEA